MRLLAVFVAMGFRRWSTYRLAAAAGAFTNTVFGLIKASITVAAIGAAGGELAGYDAATGATYAWLVQALLAPLGLFGWDELAARIRTGDVAVDLARPVDPQFAFLAADLGRAAYAFIPRGAPPLLAGGLVTGLALPAEPLPYVLGLVSVLAGVMLSFAGWWLINLTAFWLLDLRGPRIMYMVTTQVMSGLLIPVHWFPGWLGTIAARSPFPSILQTPVDVIMGHIEGREALAAIGVQLAWLVTLLVLGRLVFRLGTRKLVVQGG